MAKKHAGSSEEHVRNIRLTRAIGSNAADLISKLTISNSYAAIVELAANSYDADATEVHIDYDPDSHTLSVSDDGSGMTPYDDLPSFYRLGDSPKVANPVSSKGRRRIGKFGVATILLKYLSEEYSLSTRKDGLETIVNERFEGSLNPDAEIPFETKPVDSSAHGTTIVMRGLNFNEDTGFSIKELKRAVQWGLPILPDYKIFIDKERVISKSITNATQFRVSETGEKMGHVRGSIYFTHSRSEMAGLHVYVNRRRIGDPKSFIDIGNVQYALRDRIVGIIDADELEDAILFDRGRFRDDHPGYVELMALIKSSLREIRRYVSTRTVQNTAKVIRARRRNVLETVKRTLGSAGLEEITYDTVFDFSDDLSPAEQGRYDAESKRLVINPGHPSLQIRPGMKLADYQTLMLCAAIDSLAIARAKMNGSGDKFEAFMSQREELWRALGKPVEAHVEGGETHPMIVYTMNELAKNSSMSPGGIRYVANAGLLDVDGEGGVTGRSFTNLRRRTTGLITLYDFFVGRHDTNMQASLERISGILHQVGDAAEPFFRNYGNQRNECYFVETTARKGLDQLLCSDSFDLRRKGMNLAAPFQFFGNSFYSLPELEKRSEGLSIQAVSGVIDYAKHHSLTIEQQGTERVKFKYRDFVSALQHQRGNI